MAISKTPILILAGGFGTRLKSLVSNIPKPMAPVKGIPFLEYIIKSTIKQGFKDIILLTGYKSQIIEDYFKNGEELGCSIRYIVEDEPLGTGGATLAACKKFKVHNFILMNGDTIAEIELQKLTSTESNNCVALKEIQDTSRYGKVEIDEKENITSFIEKNNKHEVGLINAGVYHLRSSIFDDIDQRKFSLEEVVLPSLAKKRQLKYIIFTGKFLDIGIPEDYLKAEEYLS